MRGVAFVFVGWLVIAGLLFGQEEGSPEGAPAAAQSAPQQQQTIKVMGTVANAATGEPIPHALVSLNGGANLSAVTGSDGRFEFDAVPVGSLFLSAQRPGFYDPTNQGGGAIARSVEAHAGSDVTDLQLKLLPGARVSGRVIDEDGQPVEGAAVTLWGSMLQMGRRHTNTQASANTNGQGVYTFAQVPPGRYWVRFETTPVYPRSGMGPRNTSVAQEVYPLAYYPGTPDRSSAQLIDVNGGQEAEADFSVHSQRAYSISGVVTGYSGNFVQVEVGEEDDQTAGNIGGSARVNPRNGKFSVAEVPPGTWMMSFYSQDEQGHQTVAQQTVSIKDADVQNLKVAMQATPSITVKVESPDPPNNEQGPVEGQRVPGQQVQATLRAANGDMLYAGSRPGDPSTLEINGHIRPGRYTFSAEGVGSFCVIGARSGNTDLMTNDLVIAEGTPAVLITVSLSSECATLEIANKRQANPSPAAGVYYLLASSLLRAEPKLLANAAQNPALVVTGLTPGEYRVYSIPDPNTIEYTNPEVLRQFPSQEVTLEANQTASVTIDGPPE